MKTTIDIVPHGQSMKPTDRVLLLGSCFAEEVGTRLQARMGAEQVVSNPMGVLYNPESIARVLQLNEQAIAESLFYGRDGRWHSWLGSSKVSGESRNDCARHCREALAQLDLPHTDWLLLTLGTDRCYRLRTTGEVVANCHKELASSFEEVDTDGEALRETLAQLLAANPRLQIVVTISPYRYRKYGWHEAQLSKARLLLMVDRWCREMERVNYFPAYEIVLDELRDYTYYKEDGLHPNAEAAEIVYGRFREFVNV